MRLSNPKVIHMIRRNSDGLYSTGGMSPRFTKDGKVWSQLGHLKNHLRQFDYDYNLYPYKDCSVVSFRLDMVEQVSKPVDSYMTKEYPYLS
jgi:hypothetical protein